MTCGMSNPNTFSEEPRPSRALPAIPKNEYDKPCILLRSRFATIFVIPETDSSESRLSRQYCLCPVPSCPSCPENVCGQGTDNPVVSFAEESQHQNPLWSENAWTNKKRNSFVVRERAGNHRVPKVKRTSSKVCCKRGLLCCAVANFSFRPRACCPLMRVEEHW